MGSVPAVSVRSSSVEAQALGGEVVEAPPQQPVEAEYVKAEYANPERDACAIALGGGACNIGADSGCSQLCVAPLHALGDDAAIPGSAGRGDRPCYIGRE